MLVPKLSLPQRIKGSVVGSVEKVQLVWETVDRPAALLLSLCLGASPWTVRFRDGTAEVLTRRRDLYRIIHGHLFPYGRRLIRYNVRSLGRDVDLWTEGESTGDEVLGREIYMSLPVRGLTVIDVGANIGDSAVYFSLRGAREVLAFESDSDLCRIARENLFRNAVTNVTIQNFRITGLTAQIEPQDRARMQEIEGPILAGGGRSAPRTLTLDAILERIEGNDVTLKVDCEGSEYEALMSTRSDLLSKVRHLQLEYHYGPTLLARFLERRGFTVKVSKPRYLVILPARDLLVVGDIWADRAG